ncbi:FAD-dependent oxidoreductase [Baekduia soli]|uniref:FAD-dependent oxidoreductase n=1 Tax=Baekduia soli TaxID=496014 RepID=A0A5B8U4I2_9ACTN|nr:FAD-dependent oxidoreductase [Baekduia soli]QEC48029.1 FAD-dependent oxidoreductase [Baekduia soli]
MEFLECDVVVVGTGIAGLSAALSASDGGADVVVVERAARGEHGGNTRYTEAFLRMKSVAEASDDFEDRLGDEPGHHIDPALAMATLGEEAEWHPLVRALNFTTPALIERFAQEAGPTLQWLETFGLRFESLATPFITTSTTRLMPVGGGLALVEALTAAADARSLRFAFETTARSLVERDDGTIGGLRARRADGRPLEVRADAVILACGGFQGNDEMMARYVDRAAYVRPIARGGYYDRGEGIQMALDAGAAAAGNYRLFHAEPIDPRSGLAEPALFVFPYGLLVNREGRRFVDEAPGTVDATYEAITRRILEQSGGMAYVILDEKIEDVPNYRVAIRTDQPAITAGSLDALAAALGLPADALAATIAEYNAACPTGGDFAPLAVDGRATAGLDPPKSNWARTIDTPPFRAYPISCANVFSFGGVQVTSSAQVVGGDGQVMRGLYAAGEVIGMYHGTYVGSTSVLRGAVFGRLAGAHAARSSPAPAP